MAADDNQEPITPGSGAEGGEDGKHSLLGDVNHPIKLSIILKITRTMSYDARSEFIRRSKEIFAKPNKTKFEKEWLADYVQHQEGLLQRTAIPETFIPRSDNLTEGPSSQIDPDEDEYGPGYGDQLHPESDQDSVIPADLNRLFVRPDVFDGVKPPPRRWLDQYEKAAISNGWNDRAKVKYMATFLKATAYSWLTEIVPLQKPGGINWVELRSIFVRCYLGDSERQAAKRELDRTFQKNGERVALFIPRLVQMIRALDPTRKEESITEEICGRLLPEYQEKLVLFELRQIQHLYEAGIKIEAGMAAFKASFKLGES